MSEHINDGAFHGIRIISDVGENLELFIRYWHIIHLLSCQLWYGGGAKEAGNMTLEERIQLYLEEKARQEGQGR